MVTDRWLIVGCSRRKLAVEGPVEALTLYQGGLVPEARALATERPDLAGSMSIISGRYGLVAATDLVETYDLKLDEASALALRPLVTAQIGHRVAQITLASIVVLAEPPYAIALSALDDLDAEVHWFTNPVEMWPQAQDVMRSWGWLSR